MQGRGRGRGIDDRRRGGNFQNQASRNSACELFVNHTRLNLKNVYAYLIDWGKISKDNIEHKSDAKRTSKESLKNIFKNFIFMHNYEND